MSGARSYRAGTAAEAAVARHYRDRGCTVAAARWRGAGGELDLVLRDGAGLIFVEVKKSRSFAAAAARLAPRQIARITVTAAEFLAQEPAGQDTPARFDVALLDAQGRVEIIENALGP